MCMPQCCSLCEVDFFLTPSCGHGEETQVLGLCGECFTSRSFSQPKYCLLSISQVWDSEPSTSLGVLFSPLTSASPTLAPLYDEKMNLKS